MAPGASAAPSVTGVAVMKRYRVKASVKASLRDLWDGVAWGALLGLALGELYGGLWLVNAYWHR